MPCELHTEVRVVSDMKYSLSVADLITFTSCPAHQVLPPIETIKKTQEMNAQESLAPKLLVIQNILDINPQEEGQGKSAALLLHYFQAHTMLLPGLSQANRPQATTKPLQ